MLPADTTASPSPLRSIFSATDMDESLLRRVAVLGSSSIVIISRASNYVGAGLAAQERLYFLSLANQRDVYAKLPGRSERAQYRGLRRTRSRVSHCVNKYPQQVNTSFALSGL